MDRRDLLRLAAAGTAFATQMRDVLAQAALPGEIAEASVAGLSGLMQSGAQSAVSIAQSYLARIDAIDRAGPAINAIIERNPDALAIAEALDRERREKGARGPLHGIPVAAQGQHRHRGQDAHQRGIARAGRIDRGARRVRCRSGCARPAA